MAKNLVVVESPAKCKTISKYLGPDYAVKATMGHIIDLPEKELGIDFENNFKPKYVVSQGKKKVLAMLKEEAAKADTVYLAPDPDREGEAIAWHVATSIAKKSANVKRIFLNEITKKAVLAAVEKGGSINMDRVNAQQARRVLDRIVGYQVSPFLWKTVFRGLSAGRVQSVALRIICEREDEINAFKQEEYWSIEAVMFSKKVTFPAKLVSIDGGKFSLGNQEETQKVIDRLKGAKYAVKDIQRTEKERKPYAPFITSTLQQDAARKLGYSAAKTMMIAQQLYEGLELGDLGATGLITYMRTDSTRSADDALTAAREIITSMYSKKHLPPKPIIYAKSKNAQDAHEAIRPAQLTENFTPDFVKKFLSKDQFKLYELIWKRFLASQMANAVFDKTRIDIESQGCVFRANGSIIKFDGFLALYDETVEDGKTDAEDENGTLPVLDKGDAVTCKDVAGKQHFTQPPPRYSEASLVRELEEKGIGRPSTYAQIIDTLKNRKYVTVEARRFTPTEIGIMVKKLLVAEFPDIFSVGFTSSMEGLLDKVEAGEADWVETLRNFYTPFEKQLNIAKEHIAGLKAQNQEDTGRMCPECNKHSLIIKWSRNGKFLACQGFPTCRYTEPLEKPEQLATEEKCDKCGAPMVVLQMRGNKFLGCSKYPECKSTKSISTGIHCPQKDCEGSLIERRTKRGKTFFGCSAYPKCTFATWDKPLNEPCPTCQYPVITYKETKTKGNYKKCPSCKAEFPVAETDEGDVTA